MQKAALIAIIIVSMYCNAAAQFGTTDTAQMHISATELRRNNMIAGTWNNRIYLSTDSGRNWRPVYQDAPTKYDYISKVVASGDKVFAQSGSILLVSADHGMSWKPKSIIAQNKYIGGFGKFKGSLYASTNHGLYRSADNGDTWTMVAAVGDIDIRKAAIGENQMLLMVSPEPAVYNYFASSDGVNWTTIKDVPEMEILEVSGNFIAGFRCSNALNEDELSLCRYQKLWLLNEKAGKLEYVNMEDLGAMVRHYAFDKDKIYALTVNVEEKKDRKTGGYDYTYKREVLMSDDRGKNWEPINDTTNAFVVADYRMQARITEMEFWKKEEIEQATFDRKGIEIGKAKLAETRRQMRGSSSYGHYGSLPNSSSSPDYRGLSNDRFKEMNNHRDSWIDSQGRIHTH